MSFWALVDKVIESADVVLFVVDARMPEMSQNKNLTKAIVRHRKNIFLVFNKIDLLNPKDLEALQNKYFSAYFVAGSKNLGINKLRTGLKILQKRTGQETIRVGVVGYPNVGKSSIINALTRRKHAPVSAKAGTTRGIQWIDASGGIRILDSPGVVPLYDSETKLGLMAAKNAEKLHNPEKVAFEVIQMFIDEKSQGLEEYYGIKIGDEDVDIVLENIGRKRNFLKKGGVVDIKRTAIQVIQDWQRGKIKI